MVLSSVCHLRPRLVRTAVAAAASLAVTSFGSVPASAQWVGFEKPVPQKRVKEAIRYRSERRVAAIEKAEPKKEAKKKVDRPELPQMAFAIVSLADQHVSIYGADGLITRSSVSTGQAGHRTPTGIFTILEKQRWHESNIYSGAPMPYMQRITWSGVAMHEGVVPGYPASHGCIRLPAAFAARLWTMTKPGTRVIIGAGELHPFEFGHPALPVPRMAPLSEYPMAAEPAPPPVTLASNDPEAVTAPHMMSIDGATEKPRTLNPLEVAYALKAKAAAAAADAKKRTDLALADARAASVDADAASAELRRARLDLERAEARLDATRIAVKKLQDDAPASASVDGAAKSEAVMTASTPPPPSPLETARAALAAAEDAVKVAAGRLSAARADDDAKSATAFDRAGAARNVEKAFDTAKDLGEEARRRMSPVNIVVSRKEGMILVRQGQKAVYEAPITFADPDKPLGTHIFIAIDESGDAAGLDWAAITAPTGHDDAAKPRKKARSDAVVEAAAPPPEPSGPEEALERINWPNGAKERIAELIWVGGSLVVTDRGLSNESGSETDLNVSLP